MRPKYMGCLPAYDPTLEFYVVIPALGYASLHGVNAALLHAINFDRVQRGLHPLQADALDTSYLTTIPKACWMFPGIGEYLAFRV